MIILFKPQQKYPHNHHILNSLYFYISMDFPIYLPTTHFFVLTFFWKKYGWRIPYLPTVWTNIQNFVVFRGASLSRSRPVTDSLTQSLCPTFGTWSPRPLVPWSP